MITQKIKFKGELCSISEVEHYFLNSGSFNRSSPTAMMHFQFLREVLFEIAQNNIVVPLIKTDNHIPYFKDKEGFRLLDYKVIDGRDFAKYNGIDHYCQGAIIPYYGDCGIAASLNPSELTTVQERESYNKALNMTFLVSDKELYKWINGLDDDENSNVAKKRVQDCSVKELLFAIKNKLR